MSFPAALHAPNLSVGVVASVQWQAYVTPDIRVGIEGGGNVAFSPNLNALYILNLVGKFTYTIGIYPFEIPLSLAAGVNWVKYIDQSTIDPLVKPSISIDWIYNSSLTFGLNLAYWWDMQFAPDPTKSRAGNSIVSCKRLENKASTSRGGGFEPRPLKEACFFVLFLFEPLVFFLVSYVATYLLFIQPYRRYAIAAAPEMISPVWFPLQALVVLKYSYCCLALQNPHQF